jgi:hypothetical protein
MDPGAYIVVDFTPSVATPVVGYFYNAWSGIAGNASIEG